VGTEPVHVLYIAAKGRSGSTILGCILGAVEGFTYIGETQLGFFDLGAERLCGCGVPVAACPTWQAVSRHAGRPLFEQHDGYRGLRTRHLPAALLGAEAWLRARVADELREGERLCRAVRAASGARVIVDSSKPPSWGLMLGLMPSVVLHVVHLVRDPRAVAYSWTKDRPKPDRPGSRTVPQRPAVSAVTWTISNLWAEVCWRRSTGGRLRLRYEDFAAHPRAAIAAVVGLTGVGPARLPFVDERTVDLPPDHAAAGNGARMARGLVAIRPDEEWRSALPAGARRRVAALTHPLRRRYGYARRATTAWAPWRPAPEPASAI